MSRKVVEFQIATKAILDMLAAVPNGCWFLFQNVRIQGAQADKPADSKMSDKKERGYTFIGQADEDGVMLDIAATVESPAISWRVDEDGKRIQGTNYPSVLFRGDLAKQAKADAKAWNTINVFGKVETSRKVLDNGKSVVSTVFTALAITPGTQTVSKQLASDVSIDLTVTK